jgi:hypothetical protein
VKQNLFIIAVITTITISWHQVAIFSKFPMMVTSLSSENLTVGGLSYNQPLLALCNEIKPLEELGQYPIGSTTTLAKPS